MPRKGMGLGANTVNEQKVVNALNFIGAPTQTAVLRGVQKYLRQFPWHRDTIVTVRKMKRKPS